MTYTKETSEKRKTYLEKCLRERGEYSVFLWYKELYGDSEAARVYESLPAKLQDRIQKNGYRIGLEDWDFRSPSDYGDPEAEKTFRN